MPRDFIQKAIKKPGAFTKQAHRAGYTNVQAYARYVLSPAGKKKTTERTQRRARLAQTLAMLSRKKRR